MKKNKLKTYYLAKSWTPHLIKLRLLDENSGLNMPVKSKTAGIDGVEIIKQTFRRVLDFVHVFEILHPHYLYYYPQVRFLCLKQLIRLKYARNIRLYTVPEFIYSLNICFFMQQKWAFLFKIIQLKYFK